MSHLAQRVRLARAALTRKQVPVPIGAGLIGFEERLDAELRVISLPEGRDPDEVIPPAHYEAVAKIIGFIMGAGKDAAARRFRRGAVGAL